MSSRPRPVDAISMPCKRTVQKYNGYTVTMEGYNVDVTFDDVNIHPLAARMIAEQFRVQTSSGNVTYTVNGK